MDEEIDPLDVLKEDLGDDQIEVQLDAVRNLRTIVLALGPERASNQLIQFLEQHCFPIEVQAAKSPETYSNVKALACKEEVMREIALVLDGTLVPHFGGSERVGKDVLPFLEKLAMVEETVIREAAVNSIVEMAKVMDNKHHDPYIMPIIAHLTEGDWWTSRFSGASLAPQMYGVMTSPKSREQILEIILRLCKDEMPMVRQQAFRFIPKIIGGLPEDRLMTFMTPVLKSLAKELQESIRNTMVDMMRELSKVAKSAPVLQLCITHFNQMVSDENWRVRKRFLAQLIEIATHCPAKFRDEHVLRGFAGRLKDTEPSVRVKAIKLLPEFLPLCSEERVGKEVTAEIVTDLVEDQYPEVREAISASFLFIGPALRDVEVLSTLKAFSIDEQGEVRLNFCSVLGKAASIIGMDQFKEHLMAVVIKLHTDPKWRVRAEIIENITELAKLMGEAEFEHSTVLKMLFKSFKDPVSDVRDRSVSQVVQLTEAFGFEWTKKVVLPNLLSVYDEQNKFLHRMVPVKAAKALAPIISNSECPSLMPVVLKACKDQISNVRLAAAQALIELLPKTENDVVTKDVRPVLEPMLKDKDQDAKYFAKIALRKASYSS